MSSKSDLIFTGVFRLAFPDLIDPKPDKKTGKIKYAFKMIVPKANGRYLDPPVDGSPADHEGTLKDMRRIAYAALKAEYGDQKVVDEKTGQLVPNPKWPSDLRYVDIATHISPNGKDGWPLRDGDRVGWGGFAGTVFVKASSGFKIPVVDSQNNLITNLAEARGGLLCRAQINAYTYDGESKGVTFGISVIQILKDDGVSFAGVADPTKVFGKYGAPPQPALPTTPGAGPAPAPPAAGGFDPFAVG